MIEQIRRMLIEDGELITPERVTGETLAALKKRFFNREEIVRVGALRGHFARLRSWPMLESPQVLDQILRDGVARGMWCLFFMADEPSTQPEKFYGREDGGVPLHEEIQDGFAIVTPEGAIQRGWAKGKEPEPAKVENWVQTVAYDLQSATVHNIKDGVIDRFGPVAEDALEAAVSKLVQKEHVLAYKGAKGERTPLRPWTYRSWCFRAAARCGSA